MRKTKIVCTLGPASSSEQIITEMMLAGMNVARLNFSHGTHETQKLQIEKIKKLREQLGLPIAILLDTKGPEIRLCDFKNGKTELIEGESFTLTIKELPGNSKIASVTYMNLPNQIKPGGEVLIDDGKVMLKVENTDAENVYCRVVVGGVISNHKGINIPGTHMDAQYLSENDKKDILFGIENDIDFIAASFIRSKDDVIALRKFIDYNGGHSIKIISKIENLEGVNNFNEILNYSDGIMIARGDMGVEVAYERLPGLQKKFIKKCYKSGKMVITATQMLESMVSNPTPTRAEITDVANAVFDGTSAVMLSGESAAGKYPVQSIKVMAKIVAQAEKDAFEMDCYKDIKYDVDTLDITNAICDAACITAKDVNVKAIIAVTRHGHTARRMSKFRPQEPIVASTPIEKTFYQLALSWGVFPVLARWQTEFDELIRHAIDCAKQVDLVAEGDMVVITAGIPLDSTGNTNLLKVQVVQ
ncbi:MAG: pyruvate kinase [Clostridiales bacterium GWF2_38_85]|nr:MAG: pyruvate kinase [Clostridiales bacterium GWF2_38_85]HBL85221.1 pyruvate kinase [Clostridiales bacterium]